jgi:hypothetical protein
MTSADGGKLAGAAIASPDEMSSVLVEAKLR